ncbi:MAG TPA: OsmC family protein [Candidatus Thermoplasmatota archaeon]|nr:OsmC family protein [Candidatus Thermoplasmatota archaeon]
MAFTESARAVPRSPVSVAVTARTHTAVQDKPQASGGADEGMMASEHLLVALLACQHSTFVKVAAKRRVQATVHAIDGTLHFDDHAAITHVTVEYELEAPEATDDQVATLLRLTDKACTVSQALRVPVEATYRRTPARRASST